MNDEKRHIANILNRFFNGESTLAEEEELGRYFATPMAMPSINVTNPLAFIILYFFVVNSINYPDLGLWHCHHLHHRGVGCTQQHQLIVDSFLSRYHLFFK